MDSASSKSLAVGGSMLNSLHAQQKAIMKGGMENLLWYGSV